MSTNSNVYSQGGGGNTFEFEVQTAYMIQFLIGGAVPGLSNSHIESIRFQSGSLGYKIDDLLIECADLTVNNPKVLFQIKHALTISEKSLQFCEVLENCWKDFFNKKLFNPLFDKIYIVKSYLTLDEKKHLKTICNWARVKGTASDFINEINRIEAKKTYLEMFRNILQKKHKKAITDNDLFRLFFCLDFMEYDFGETSSIAKSNFLTVIEYAKNTSCTITADLIWDSVFAHVSHSDNKGALYNISNLPAKLTMFFKVGFYHTAQKSILNMSCQGYEIIDIIKDNIGGIVLKRPEYLEKIATQVNGDTVTIITGAPGSGKSVIAKHFINEIRDRNNGFVLIFKADELNKINLRDYFLRFDVHLPVKEIFSFFPLSSNNYIYIDSLEKLLEGEGDAFMQLQKMCTPENGIKIIATCREADLPLIRIKYLSESRTEPVKIQLLSDLEITFVQDELPSLKDILKNKRIRSLLKIPKYLDFTYRAHNQSGNNFSDIDEPDFVKHLWNIIIENRLNNNIIGLPERRSKQFIELSVQRAKSMTPYVVPDNLDIDAIANLERDGVIIKSTVTDAYSPSHDILEDWALIRYVDKIFFQDTDAVSFFASIGKEPAMRRAFRLWTLHAFKAQDIEKIAFLTQILTHTNVENYWQDESVIALLQTPYLEIFFESHVELLLRDNLYLLEKLIHLMRTSCREYESIDFLTSKKFIPVGDSWGHVLNFVSKHIVRLPVTKYGLVLHTINDWHYVLYKQEDLSEISSKAGAIIKHLLESYYLHTNDYYNANDNVLLCIKLLMDCCGGMTDQIKNLIQDASNNNEEGFDHSNAERSKARFHKKVIDTVLSGLNSTQVAKYLPIELIGLLKKEWFYYQIEEVEEENNDASFSFGARTYRSDESNLQFGISSEYKRDYFPASAYQTPVYWLLIKKPFETCDFVIELFNHSVSTFVKSDYVLSDERSQIEIHLPGEQKMQQHGSMGLWCMFRGTGISTPYLLQSVLMALEKYLLELAQDGFVQKDLLQSLIEKIIRQSTTVSLTAVVASIAQAYPLMIGKWVVCLFSARKMMYWDIIRCRADQNHHYLIQTENTRIYQKERIESDKLPHRLKHQYGLKGFIVNYCLQVGEYNKEIFNLLDKHKKAAQKNDWEWKAILTDIDIRNWQITKKKILEDKIQFQIEPVHKGKLKKEVKRMREEANEFVESSTHANWLLGIEKSQEKPDINTFRTVINYYKSRTELNMLHHHPGVAASIGVRHFWKELTIEEKQWCFDILRSIATTMISKEYVYDYPVLDVSPFDDDAVMSSLPLLLGAENVDQKEFIIFLTTILFANISYDSPWYNSFLMSFSANVWSLESQAALRIWKVLVSFAKIENNNPHHKRSSPVIEEIDIYNKSVAELFESLFGEIVDVSVEDIDFDNNSQWVILKIIKFIPSYNTPEICIELLFKIVKLLIEVYHTSPESKRRLDRIDYQIQAEIETKIANVILWNASTGGAEMLQKVIDMFYSCYHQDFANSDGKRDAIGLFRNIIKNIIYATDANLPKDDQEKLQQTLTSFNTIWIKFFEILNDKSTILSGDLLFLNIGWNENSRHWRPLETMTTFFKKLILLFGYYYTDAVVNLLSHIGDQTLLPDGLTILWVSLQKAERTTKLRSIPHIEQLVYRVYNHHLVSLKKDKILLNDYISLLDALIKEGSSDAYWIREYLISFR